MRHSSHFPLSRHLVRTLPACAMLVLLAGCATSNNDTSAPTPHSITGRYIAVLCDADMAPTAFATGDLGTRKPGATDCMTVISLPIADPDGPNKDTWQTTVAQVGVSNSAIGPPVSIAVSKDGNRAYAVESRGPAGPTARTITDLPLGRLISAVDMTNPGAPVLLGTAQIGVEPTSVDVHPDADYVAVATKTPGKQLVLVPTSATQPLGEPLSWPLTGIADPNAKPSSVAWHPSGNYVAVTLPETNQVAFYEFGRSKAAGGMPGFAPWGDPVTVGKYPFSGKFSPDGKYFIATDLQWGADVEGFLAGAPEGQLSVIKLSNVPSSVKDGNLVPGLVQHEVVSTARVGISPESLVISPDGKFVVTANDKRSFFPDYDPRGTPGGSLSLLSFDASSGALTTIGEFNIPSMPQGLAFDATGRNLVVSQFRSFNPEAVDGELAFYKVVGGTQPTIIPGDFFVGVGIGPHGVVIVR